MEDVAPQRSNSLCPGFPIGELRDPEGSCRGQRLKGSEGSGQVFIWENARVFPGGLSWWCSGRLPSSPRSFLAWDGSSVLVMVSSLRCLWASRWPWDCSASTLTWPPSGTWLLIGRPCTRPWRKPGYELASPSQQSWRAGDQPESMLEWAHRGFKLIGLQPNNWLAGKLKVGCAGSETWN